LSKQPRNVRRTLIEVFRRAKRERDALIDIIHKQRTVMLEQQALIHQQHDALIEMREGLTELKAMAVRNGLLNIAIDIKREDSPLQ
jgi:hypothetical protein